jgi:hypothetical protein
MTTATGATATAAVTRVTAVAAVAVVAVVAAVAVVIGSRVRALNRLEVLGHGFISYSSNGSRLITTVTNEETQNPWLIPGNLNFNFDQQSVTGRGVLYAAGETATTTGVAWCQSTAD